MKQRILSLLVLTILMLGLLAACGGDVPPTTNPEVPTAESPTDAAPNDNTGGTQPTMMPTEPAAEAPTDVPAPSTALTVPYLEYGAAAQLYYTDRDRALTLMQNARFDWVRQQIQWKDIEGPKGNFGWGELDAIVDSANAHNLKIMLSVVRTPSWARADGTNGLPDNVSDMGDFVEALATRYRGRVQAYEIWNEQNLDVENGGSKANIDPGKYVEMLVESYNRIKAVDPDAFVISGALTSTGDSPTAIEDMEYYRQMFTYNDGILRTHVDGIGFHPSPSYNSPDTLWPDNPGPGPGWREHPSHYFRHIENLRQVMDETGMSNYQVWITEMGWATQNETPGYEYGNAISFDQQGQWLLEALQRIRSDYPYVAVAIIWNLNFAVTWGETNPPQPLHEQASFGILNPDWSPRPAYTNLQGFINAVKTEEGR